MTVILKTFETGAERFQPDSNYTFKYNPQYTLDQQFLAFLVGCVALGLPVVMLLGAPVVRCFFDSISHFYYAQFFGDVLVASLAVIGTFLVAYRGENPRESRIATFAGLWAFGIALFPTTGRGCNETSYLGRAFGELDAKSSDVQVYFELFNLEHVGLLHFGFAALLFGFLAYYSFHVFTRTVPARHFTNDGSLTPVKKTRNRIYIWSGWVIVISMLAIAVGELNAERWAWWDGINATFWFEAFALWAFGISWMVKGRFWETRLLDQRDEQNVHAVAASRGVGGISSGASS